jgi:imidazolonepropionase-like amidohydrolase
MIKLNTALLFIIIQLLFGCNALYKLESHDSFLVIKNINVIDVVSGNIIPNQEVIIKNQHIQFIGQNYPKRIPENAAIIDGTMKYLSPGFWDMHFHLCWQNDNDTLLFPILLKNGITGIREMGGDLKIMKEIKLRIAQGKLPGLTIYGPGPMIDGNPPVYSEFSIPVDDNSKMSTILDSLKQNGADFFKTYSLIKENQLRAISMYCIKNKYRFAGHLSEYIDPEVSIALGQQSVEHLNRLDEIWKNDPQRIERIGKLMLTNHTAICPTLITYQLKTRVRDSTIYDKNYDNYIPSSLMNEWKSLWQKRTARHKKLDDWDAIEQFYKTQLDLVNHLHNMGVMILAGSDFAGMPFVYPGKSLHEELELFVKAGLSNHEALKTATINPALFMSAQDQYGTIEIGKYADLIIFSENPLSDIRNTRTIQMVLSKGKVCYTYQ